MSTAVDLVRRFRQLRALVIGDAMLDTYLEGTAARLCREGPVPVVRKTAEHRIPGGAANTAANPRALDAEVFFLSIIGQDMAGATLRSSLREQDIDDHGVVEDESTGIIALTGHPGGKLSRLANLALRVPARSIEQVEDAHLVIAHSLCVVLREQLCMLAALPEVEPSITLSAS